jgi:Cysteine-rich CPCC
VEYQGESVGWGAYVAGERRRPASAGTPVEAIAAYLDAQLEEVPLALREFSEQLEHELHEAPRYVCDCCGYRTLLNPGYYEICAVCGWEDDRCDKGRTRGGPDAPSGPNRISLAHARANFRRLGAAKEGSRQQLRDPRPDEQA